MEINIRKKKKHSQFQDYQNRIVFLNLQMRFKNH